MWQYEKRLQYPVKIKNPNPKYAQIIISQLGGPDGEIGASLRYLTQRIAMPYSKIVGILTDVGTEELAHFEMISAILYQLTRNLTPKEIKESGFDTYFVDHTTGIYPVAAMMGLAFKPNIDDLRESPSKYIVTKVMQACNNANILIVEPNVETHQVFKLTNYQEAYEQADIVVFLTAHDPFKTLEWRDDKVILDFCGIFKK